MELALSAKGRGLIFDHKKPQKCTDLDVFPPKLRDSVLTGRLKDLGYTRGPRRIISVNHLISMQVVFGKLAARFSYHAFVGSSLFQMGE
jgi:hypothetical protein